MLSKLNIRSLLTCISMSAALPTALNLSNPDAGPVPSETSYYSDYRGKSTPFPANITSPILPTIDGPPGPDDLLFQNLLSAEWAIFSLYQQGVEAFNVSSFTSLGLPNTTYDRIQEIRDNEAGHLRIFQDSISNSSIKPGSCSYNFGWSNASEFLALQVIIEVSSMVFAAGLVQQANTNVTKGALMGIGETESRHETWALTEVWGANPFAGPIDTSFPYANQILDRTNLYVVPGSCPDANPIYPYPRQNLPQLSATGDFTAGGNVTIVYEQEDNIPTFEEGKEYFAVFFHGLVIDSVPFDVQTNSTTFPANLELRGMTLVVIADEIGAPTEDSVVAGPAFITQWLIDI